MVTHLERIETKRYILDEMEVDTLENSIKIIEKLEREGFSSSEYYPTLGGVTEVLNAIIDNDNRKLWKNDDTEEFELEIED